MTSAVRNLAWRLNWYRQSELEGALLLGRVIRHAADGELIARLTKHCAEEAHHAQLWADCLRALELPFIRIHRSYQSFFIEHGGTPSGLTEVLAFTQIFERRVHKRFNDEAARPDTPPPARETFAIMIRDEKDHLQWVHDWLKPRPDASALLNKYIAIDRAVYETLLPYEDHIWDLPGLGEEVAPPPAR